MKVQRQGIGSTRITDPPAEETKALDATKKEKIHETLILTYKIKSIMYPDQMGKFPHLSIRGGKYQIILHDIDSNSTWVESF